MSSGLAFMRFGQAGDHFVDLFRRHLRRGDCLRRVERPRVAEHAVGEQGDDGQEQEQGDGRLAARAMAWAAVACGGRLRPLRAGGAAVRAGLFEIGFGQRAFGVFAASSASWSRKMARLASLRSVCGLGARRPSQSGGRMKAATTTMSRVAKMANWVISGRFP
jgi:hypothetical protein